MQNQKGISSLAIILIIVAVVIVIGGGVLAYQYFSTKTQPVVQTQQNQNLTPEEIFQETSSQLGFTRSQVVYFRVFGQDKIQYSFGSGTNFAYKTNDQWYLAGIGNYQDVADCIDYNSVPSQYNPGCYDKATKQNKYLDGQGQSVNYPPSQMTSYIGQ
jgi:hypothetical protein